MSEPSEAAKLKACDLVEAEYTEPFQKRYDLSSVNKNNPSILALARQIQAVSDAAKEVARAYEGFEDGNGEPCPSIARLAPFILSDPVDPLLIEARELVAKWWEDNPRKFSSVATNPTSIRNGEADETPEVTQALVALKRGMELAGKQTGEPS